MAEVIPQLFSGPSVGLSGVQGKGSLLWGLVAHHSLHVGANSVCLDVDFLLCNRKCDLYCNVLFRLSCSGRAPKMFMNYHTTEICMVCMVECIICICICNICTRRLNCSLIKKLIQIYGRAVRACIIHTSIQLFVLFLFLYILFSGPFLTVVLGRFGHNSLWGWLGLWGGATLLGGLQG